MGYEDKPPDPYRRPDVVNDNKPRDAYPPLYPPVGRSVFLPRDAICIRGTSRGPVSVCVCVRLSQVGVLSKRLNESSCFLACELPSIRPTLC